MSASSEKMSASSEKVFLDYDQAELDRCYDQANWAPNQSIVHERSDFNSARAREALGNCERLAYGPAEIEKLDLFKAAQPGEAIAHLLHIMDQALI